jgi:Fe-S cluster assembly protein SufD
MHDFRTIQDHDAPHTTSDLLFKGAVQDHAASVYTGLIKIREHARGTNAFQTNRNLTLSEGAWAESVPNLDIRTNDVKCSHASTVGPIDEDQRFYLESRGIRPEVAERLVVLGFFDEVLGQLPAVDLVADLRARVAAKLNIGEQESDRA